MEHGTQLPLSLCTHARRNLITNTAVLSVYTAVIGALPRSPMCRQLHRVYRRLPSVSLHPLQRHPVSTFAQLQPDCLAALLNHSERATVRGR